MLIADSLDLRLRLVSLSAQIAVPFVIFYAGRFIARAQYTKSMQDAWSDFNKLVIANSDNIGVVRKIVGLGLTEHSEEDIRKDYLVFVLLNIFQAAYFGAKHGLLDRKYQRASFEDLLRPLMANDDIFELSQRRGYHPKFAKECRKIRASCSISE